MGREGGSSQRREARETPAAREARLARQREDNARRRRATTCDHGDEHSRVESLAHYNARLARQREYSRRRRQQQIESTAADAPGILREGEEQRSRRREYQRAYAAARRERERATRERQRIERECEHAERRQRRESCREPMGADPSLSEPSRLEPVSEDVVQLIEQRLRAALGASGLDECVCGVCDRLSLRSTTRRVRGCDNELLEVMQRVLQAPHTSVPRLLVEQYDCEDMDHAFAGMMLSRAGITLTPTGAEVNACTDCYSSLLKNTSAPPKFAIANGFFVGHLPPNLSSATWMEKVMTQLVTVVAQTRIMRGGIHRSIQSHCMVFDATPGPPATLLPRRVDRDSSYRVVLAGPITAQQTDRIRKLHAVRGRIVMEILRFFKCNNHFYSDVEIDEHAIQEAENPALFDQISIAQEGAETSEAIDEEQDSVSGPSGVRTRDNASDCDVIERNVLLTHEDVSPDSSFLPRVVDLNADEPAAPPRLQLHHSSRFASVEGIEAKMHSHLFPFGRGHPGEERLTKVSKRECIQHYLMLSSRQFAQDPTFLLTSFDRLALEKMYTLTSVKCKRFSSLYDGYESITRDDLAAALLNNERRQRGVPRGPVNPVAERFLKSVELGSASVWGSSAERRQCRQEAFSYQTRYGQPSLFVTLTPNTDNSYAMAHYTGTLSVDTLFDSLEARVPTETEMKRAAMNDDSAAGRLFIRMVNAFIANVLGVDPATQSTRPEGGLFGRTKAYYGMVETQGRGTLHIHFLIWLYGAPTNSAAFDQKIDEEGESFVKAMEEYVDSIVTTRLPIPVEEVGCSKCHTLGSLTPLPVPSIARRECPKRKADSQREPLLVACQVCEQQTSAQHVIRRALMINRPPHWPPPLRPLTPDERTARLEQERPSRVSEFQGVNALREREMVLAALGGDASDNFANWLLRIQDDVQLPHLNKDEDPLRNDEMHRLIEMLPPMEDYARMTPTHRAYMLACLVVRCNLHAWSHTGSCFKKSSATSSKSSCRYGFPRARAATTSISGSSIVLKRDFIHEYINGYNPTVMEMFKCNHDIQVLFGGKEAINRIYYCCKYVTKPQRQIDSATAVGLASFQRRQAKEIEDFESSNPPTVSDVRRRRVTGLIHTFTNKQEIAGPLAALYLFRGSCCYASTYSVRLPLTDIFKQLESNDDYVCTLVRTGLNQDAMYRSASTLDDYLYRPEHTEDANLYQYTIRCYRRTATNTTSEAHRFRDEHPLSASHCVAYRQREAVPVIKRPRLPRIEDVDDAEKREEYAKIALVLFKPFRNLEDLIGTAATDRDKWYSAYCAWETSRSPFTRTIMSNMNDYHAARAAETDAIMSNEDDGDASEEDNSSDDGYDSEDMLIVDDVADDIMNIGMVDFTSESDQESSAQHFPAPPHYCERIQSLLREFDTHQLVHTVANSTASFVGDDLHDARPDVFHADKLRQWVVDSNTDVSQANTDGRNDTTPLPRVEIPTRLNEIIDEALQPQQLQWSPVVDAPPENTAIPPYAGIARISSIFTLNKQQHAAFEIVASHVLRRWRVAPNPQQAENLISDEDLQNRQLLLFLGGEGGTGKSRVITALQQLCRSWQRPESLVVAAMTGKAATLVGGRTLASFLMALRNPSCRSAVQDLDCLIVDEVSMMSKNQLLRLDRLLRKAKGVKDVPFGGVHVILVGDFLQLPPIGADPIYIDPESKKSVSLVDFEGFELWRRFDKVVVLTESVRFREDPEWGIGCSKARYGEWTSSFLELINERQIQKFRDTPCADAPRIPATTKFVTPDNETRTAINQHFIAHAAKLLPQEQLPIRVVANFKGALRVLSAEDLKLVMGLPDTKFGRMAPYLDLIPGMPIQITQNIRTKKGVANGTMGFFHSVKFPEGTSFHRMKDKRTGVVILVPNKRPLFALLHLDRGSNVHSIAPDVSPELFPVFPDEEPFSKSTIRLTPSCTGETRILSIKIQQFHFVCAVGATVYKVQGESLQSMGVVDWKIPGRGAGNKPQQAYLMVSRVTKRSGLFTMKPFTADIARWAKPPASAVDEDRRLAEESQHTLQKLYHARNE